MLCTPFSIPYIRRCMYVCKHTDPKPEVALLDSRRFGVFFRCLKRTAENLPKTILMAFPDKFTVCVVFRNLSLIEFFYIDQ